MAYGEEYSITISKIVANDDPAKRYEIVEYFPASRRRITKLEWGYARPGGCDQLSCELQLPYDVWGADFRLRRVQHFQDLELRIRDKIWWRGFVESIQPKLATPEVILLQAKGYAAQCEKAMINWTYSRQALKYAGDVGEIAGVVRSLLQFAPLLLGSDPRKPHPVADHYRIDASATRPRGLVFDNVSLTESLTELATLAGNYDWGVDENREFYFLSPQNWTDTTAQHSLDESLGEWTNNASVWIYGDESYTDPQGVPPFLAIDENAVFVRGNDLSELETGDSITTAKNVLIVIAAPRVEGGQPTLITVADSEWIDFWGRRIIARIATPFFSEADDVRRWARQRLRFLGRPQTAVKIHAPVFRPFPIHALGAVRVLDPDTGQEIVERILSVKYRLEKDDQILCDVEAGYQPPADQYFAEQLRRDATLAQNTILQERVPFIVSETMKWYRDGWTPTLS